MRAKPRHLVVLSSLVFASGFSSSTFAWGDRERAALLGFVAGAVIASSSQPVVVEPEPRRVYGPEYQGRYAVEAIYPAPVIRPVRQPQVVFAFDPASDSYGRGYVDRRSIDYRHRGFGGRDAYWHDRRGRRP